MLPKRRKEIGIRCIVVYPDDSTEYQVAFRGFKESTISRMEISACIAAMKWVKGEGIGRRCSRVQIFSDSQYLVDGQFSAPFWLKAKWRTAAGRPIDNSDLWKEFLSARSKAGIRIDIWEVQNNATPLLKRVDRLAKAAAKQSPPH